jgi:hypothetical protein
MPVVRTKATVRPGGRRSRKQNPSRPFMVHGYGQAKEMASCSVEPPYAQETKTVVKAANKANAIVALMTSPPCEIARSAKRLYLSLRTLLAKSFDNRLPAVQHSVDLISYSVAGWFLLNILTMLRNKEKD